MIRYKRRKEIDITKYDACIGTAINSRIYAYSWYLDIVADNWDVLVLDDYEAVMPLPFFRLKRSFFIRKLAQPNFCQQLGVFSNCKLSDDVVRQFVVRFSEFKLKTYNFNSYYKLNNSSLNYKVAEKVNYELNLRNSYSAIKKGYSKSLLRNLKKANKVDLVISSDISILQFILMKENNKKHKIKKEQYKIMKRLIKELIQRKKGNLYGVFLENKLIASAYFIEENNRFTHLFSATTSTGKEFSAISFLFDNIVENNATENMIFDFEGSMIPNVARFFKSFGAQKINYYSLEK